MRITLRLLHGVWRGFFDLRRVRRHGETGSFMEFGGDFCVEQWYFVRKNGMLRERGCNHKKVIVRW